MFYIIIEGEEGKSAHTFWSEINKQLLNNEAIVIGIPGSLEMYYKRVRDIACNVDKNLKHSMLLVFDKAPGNGVYNMMERLSELFESLNSKGINIKAKYTQDFCFEEWILSSNVTDMLKDSKYRDIIKEYCNANKNWTKTPYFIEFINEFNGGRWLNREQAAFRLLHGLPTRRNALVNKSSLGYCWTGNADDICKQDKYNNCGIDCKNRVLEAVDHNDFKLSVFIAKIMELHTYSESGGNHD